jgi:7,8-dihydropterin-6-yl-methyl-4-(beta-D-ribofuranosyl)aminobenzene 5'-phosphate synthase
MGERIKEIGNMKVTIIYDNEVTEEGLEADWGFSCLVEAYGKNILFDAGANGSILLGNMEKLGIDPEAVDEIFISHGHWDHIGGLSDFLSIRNTKVYVPVSCQEPADALEVVAVRGSIKIADNIFSTGELQGIEQSLIIETGKGLAVIAGCSHPGVRNILKAASGFGKPAILIGGLHGFSEFNLLEELKFVCPTHCTQFKSEIQLKYPEKYISGGAGRIIDLEKLV